MKFSFVVKGCHLIDGIDQEKKSILFDSLKKQEEKK